MSKTALNEKNVKYDVFFGRGRMVLKLPGNIKYKELLYANHKAYNETQSRYERDLIAENIVNSLKKNYGSKFWSLRSQEQGVVAAVDNDQQEEQERTTGFRRKRTAPSRSSLSSFSSCGSRPSGGDILGRCTSAPMTVDEEVKTTAAVALQHLRGVEFSSKVPAGVLIHHHNKKDNKNLILGGTMKTGGAQQQKSGFSSSLDHTNQQLQNQDGVDLVLQCKEQEEKSLVWIELKLRNKILRKVKQALRDLHHRLGRKKLSPSSAISRERNLKHSK